MKVFVAGKAEDEEIIVDIMDRLESLGHTVACNWLVLARRKIGRRNYAIENEKGARECDILIAYMLTEYIYRCQFVEIGIALGHKKPVVIIGKMFDDCIFRHHPNVVVVADIDAGFEELERYG